MDDWRGEYEGKTISIDDAAALVKSGDYVVFTMGREAFGLGLAIAARKDELKDVKMFCPAPSYDFGWYDDEWQDSFQVMTMMVTGHQTTRSIARIPTPPTTPRSSRSSIL